MPKKTQQKHAPILSPRTIIIMLLIALVAIASLGYNLYTNRPIDKRSKKILFVMTSHFDKGTPGEKTGYWLSEASEAHKIFTQAGYKVEYVSPKGGLPPVDVKSLDFSRYVNRAFLRNENDKLINTAQPKDINYSEYRAIYYVGGHGAMWDLVENKHLQRITSKIYENDGIVAGICHGVAGLLNVKLKNGNYLIYGKSLTGFTNEEESNIGLEMVVPFKLQSKIESRGTLFKSKGKFEENVIVDGNLLTAQNPQSTKRLAEEIINLLEAQ